MEKISYGGWDNCFYLANDRVELILTADVGPRIIHFGLVDGENIFKQFPEQMGVTTSNEWLSFGGHRLWHAPESQTRTYYPDMEPVLIQETNEGVIVTQKPEPTTGIQKQIQISLAPNDPEVKLKHSLINHNLWAIEAAPWSISVMAPGGMALLPLPPRGPHPKFILPTSAVALWPYTDLSDPCFKFFEKYILISQNTSMDTPQKIGLFASDGWAAYFNHNNCFIKQVPIQFDGVYPDFGVNFEVFTNNQMLELEALGPIESIPPKGKIDLIENWTLIADIPLPGSEIDIVDMLIPHL